MNDWTDKELFDGLRRGNKSAFSALFLRHYDSLLHYGLRIVGDRTLIEESIQELFIYLFESYDRFGEVMLVRAYLTRSLRRRVLVTISKEKRLREWHQNNIAQVDLHFSIEDLHIELKQSALQNEVIRVLNQLPWRQREAIYLRYYNGLSTKEISMIMGVANQTILNMLYQGLKKLRTWDDLRSLRNQD